MRFRRSAASAFAALAALLAVCLLAAAPLVAGHAEFITSTPAPYDIWNVSPTYVSVTVSEAVQPGSPTITVTNGTAARVDSGPVLVSAADLTTFRVQLLSGIGPSVYTVTWSVVSADDGHFTAGTFYFMVSYRNGTLPGTFPQTGTLGVNQPIAPLDVGLRAAEFLGFSVAFGGTLLAALLWIPASADAEVNGTAAKTEGLRSLLSFARIGALALGTADAGLWVENLVGSPPQTPAGALGSFFLVSLAARTILGFVMALVATPALVGSAPPRAPGSRPPELLVLAGIGFGFILLEVAAGHAATIGAWFPLGLAADATHLYGAAFWVGGLLCLVRVRRWLQEPTPSTFARAILEGFSRLALLGVVLVVSAGFLLALVLVGTVGGLLGSAYGWVVLAKGALLLPIIFLGWWNRRVLRREETGGTGTLSGISRVTRNVRMEAILGAAVLVLAGLLVTMSPVTAPGAQNPTFTLDATSGGLYALFQMNPWPTSPGDYIFQLALYYEGNGTAYVQGGNATLSFLLEGGNGTWVTLALEGPHGNHYFIDSPILDAAGTWQLRGEVRGPLGAPVQLPFQVVLRS